jgi:hypothetical protein
VDIESIEKQAKEFIHRGYPFFLRLVVIFILVESIFGFLFFFSALMFRLGDSDFLLEIAYKGLSGTGFLLFLTLLTLLHAGLMLSSILMLRKKIRGFYLYLITLPILIVISFYSENEIGFLAPILGLISILVIFLNRKSLS